MVVPRAKLGSTKEKHHELSMSRGGQVRVTRADELRRGVYARQLWPGVMGLRAVNFHGQTVKRVGVLECVYEEDVEAADLWSFLDGIGGDGLPVHLAVVDSEHSEQSVNSGDPRERKRGVYVSAEWPGIVFLRALGGWGQLVKYVTVPRIYYSIRERHYLEAFIERHHADLATARKRAYEPLLVAPDDAASRSLDWRPVKG